MGGCKYCTRKPVFDEFGEFFYFDNEECMKYSAWTGLYLGVDQDGQMIISASGDDRAIYYPKFCPECGRKL